MLKEYLSEKLNCH